MVCTSHCTFAISCVNLVDQLRALSLLGLSVGIGHFEFFDFVDQSQQDVEKSFSFEIVVRRQRGKIVQSSHVDFAQIFDLFRRLQAVTAEWDRR